MSFKKPTANEWQEFSLKKDVENLNRLVKHVCETASILIIDVIVAFAAVLFDKVYDFSTDDMTRKIIYGIAAVIIVITLIPHIIRFVRCLLRNRSVSVNFKARKEYVDSFDNEICYYVMMADSFLDMLKEDISTDSQNQYKRKFYFTETRYYLYKAVDKLSQMKFKLKQIFDDDVKLVAENRKVSIARLYNVLDNMVSIEKDIEASINNLSFSSNEKEKLGLYEVYERKFNEFLDKATSELGLTVSQYCTGK